MQFDLTAEQIEEIMKQTLLDDIKTHELLLEDAEKYHISMDGVPYSPMYSYDYKVEIKKINKMLKALKRVYNTYVLSNEQL